MVMSAAENFGAKYLAAKEFNKTESSKVKLVSL
jgi:hypothetical protein